MYICVCHALSVLLYYVCLAFLDEKKSASQKKDYWNDSD